MPKYDKYHPNYGKLYPGIEKRPEILHALKRSDRKMEYMEVDLKQERFVQDQEAGTAGFLPSREDSYDRLQDEEHVQFAMDELTPEAVVVRREEIRLLRIALRQLEPEEYDLIQALYFKGMSERQLSKQTGIHYMTIHNRKAKVCEKLKKLMER